ncbi:kinase-like domain-containing protein [Trametes elegans]|nr:kinase-like domain-containing protein [Trametes elegans]
MTDHIATLAPWEEYWRDRQAFLESHGYMLRPRYKPDWRPSWKIRSISVLEAEDSIQFPLRRAIIDATRMTDGRLVSIKKVAANSPELELVTFLSSPEMRLDSRNHSVPILDVLQNTDEPDTRYIVMPYLTYIDEPNFEIVEDMLDFGEQILEGLQFLHEHGIAHRDCAYKNIMMDPKDLYPKGFHPVHHGLLPDASGPSPVLSRAGVSLPYYFIDFGISSRFSPDDSPKLVLGKNGLERSVPELSDDVPYDPFKVDIYILGALFKAQFLQKYSNVEMISQVVRRMTNRDPTSRPDASEALRIWKSIRVSVPRLNRMWRLKPKHESFVEGALKDVYSLLSAAMSHHSASSEQHSDR